MDAALRPGIVWHKDANNYVSILVLVDAALRPRLRWLVHNGYIVSILVLVDAALRLHYTGTSGATHYGFNPCFSGCRPATRKSSRRLLR